MKKSIVIILLVAALLFVLAGIAGVLFFAFRSSGSVFNPNLVSASAEESKTLKMEGPLQLKVVDDAGSVTIVGADVKSVKIEATKTAHAPTQTRAEAELKKIQYDVKQTGDTLTIRYTVPQIQTNIPVNATSPNWETVDFVITVPNTTTVDVETGFGEVNISATTGTVNIVNKFGDVKVNNIEGSLTVDTRSGKVDASSIDAGEAQIDLTSGFGTVVLEKATGKDITLDSNSGSLEMSDVRASGRMEMSTDFGDIQFSNSSANSLSVKTNSGKVTLEQLTLEGALTAKSEFGEIGLEQVKAASYDVQTNSGSITVDGANGNVKAHSGFGSVTLRNAESATLDLSTQSGNVKFEGSLGAGPHSLHSDFGEISLSLPADSALDVDLKTNFGTIKSDIPITVVLSGELEKSHQTGTLNGGGAQLTVDTDSGNISIQASK